MATATREPSVFNLPNQLTLSRLVLGVVLFGLIEWGRALGDQAAGVWMACIVVFAVAAATDWLDGYVARLQGLVTSLGRQLDAGGQGRRLRRVHLPAADGGAYRTVGVDGDAGGGAR